MGFFSFQHDPTGVSHILQTIANDTKHSKLDKFYYSFYQTSAMVDSKKPNFVYISVQTNQTAKSIQNFKWLLILLAIVASFFLVAAIIFAILHFMKLHSSNSRQTQQVIAINNNDLCLTRYCIEAAHHLQENMDESVDPCENFYEFSCGSWMKNTKIPSDNYYESQTRKFQAEINDAIADLLSSIPPNGAIEPKAIINARRLYNSCIDEDAIESEDWDALDLLIDEEFGGWPSIFSSTRNESAFDLSYVLLKLNQYGDFPFYHVKTTIDYDHIDTMRYRIRISPAQDPIEQNSTFIDDSLLTLFERQSTEKTRYDSLTEFEEAISQYLMTSIVEYCPEDIVTTVRNLSKTIDTDFDFSDYIRRLYLLGNVTLTDDDIVAVHRIDAIRSISTIIAQQSPTILQRYILGHFLGSTAFYLPNRFLQRYIYIRHWFEFRIFGLPKRLQTILENEEITTSKILDAKSRRIECGKYVNKYMEFAVFKLYIDRYYNKLALHESTEIVDNIRNTFIDMIKQSMWMDTDSKKRIIAKAQAIRAKVGYPEQLDSDSVTKLESMYAKYKFNSSHLKSVLFLSQINAKRNFQRLREPVNRQEWTDHGPLTLNAMYNVFFNEIIIPAGIFRPPFFHKDAPKYLNYGAIGSIVGHEITHGFDESGRHIDKNGKKHALWSQKTNDMFDNRSKCIIEQYNNYRVSQIKRQVNGYKTREENIADNDGLKKAFYAYQKWVQTHNKVEKKLPGFTNYSPEQMFFISFGQLWCSKMTDEYAMAQNLNDDHSPHQFRSIGPTSNFAEFDRVFECKPGQGNSRVNKCSVW